MRSAAAPTIAPPTAPTAAAIGPPVRPMAPATIAPAAAAPPVVACDSWTVSTSPSVVGSAGVRTFSSMQYSFEGYPHAVRVPAARRLQFDRAMTLQVDPVESAAEAGLHYVSDEQPGIRRRRAGSGFSYIDPNGKPIRDQQTLLRIKHLVIPPAWTDVWICPDRNGHLQATGRDARGRKVYLYHPRWREVRDAAKYERLAAFGEALPRIRERVEADLRRHGIPREKVLAAVVKLLEETSIRVGNDEYRDQNGSVGLTTMLDDHALFEGNKVRFVFKGKSGKAHNIELNDRRLARIVKQCQDVPGQHLFQYVDEGGEHHEISSSDV